MQRLVKFWNFLKELGKPKPNDLTGHINRIKALENFAETTSRVVLSHNTKLEKNKMVHDALLDVLVEHEKEVDSVKKLINQHAGVINSIQKELYDQPETDTEESKDSDEISVKDYISKKHLNDNKDN